MRDYTTAYDKLHDPIVLFNRAECYRRLGENARAVEDYQGFLDGFPNAPNRADIENGLRPWSGRCRRRSPGPPGGVAARRASATDGATPPPAARPASDRRPSCARRAPATSTPPPAEAAGPMPFLPPPPGASGETPALVEAPRSETTETPRPAEALGSRWWLWTALAVGRHRGRRRGDTSCFGPKDEPPPPTSLGHYRF